MLDADATLRIGTDFGTKEVLCTLEAIQSAKKPSIDVWLGDSIWKYQVGDVTEYALSPYDIAYWLITKGVKTLNVTGNYCPKLQPRAYHFVLETLNIMLYEM